MARKKCKEVWLPVPGYEGFYEVSNQGLVRSVERTTTNSLGRSRTFPSKVLKPATTRRGYLRVSLCKEGNQTNHSVHRLVALAFIPGFKEGLVVRHLDHNPLNNQATNLAWGTNKDNSHDSMRDGRLKGKNQNAPKTACPKGHTYDYRYPDGRRDCTRCRNEAIRRHRARKKATKTL